MRVVIHLLSHLIFSDSASPFIARPFSSEEGDSGVSVKKSDDSSQENSAPRSSSSSRVSAGVTRKVSQRSEIPHMQGQMCA